MNAAEATAAAEKLRELNRAFDALTAARTRLNKVNRVEPGQRGEYWVVDLDLRPHHHRDSRSYNEGDYLRKFRIPFAMVQQQCVDDVRRAERAVIALGGTP